MVCDSYDGLTAFVAAGDEALIETRRLDENRDLRKVFLLSALLYNSIDAAAAAVVDAADISQADAFSLCQAPDWPSHSQKGFGEHKEKPFERTTKKTDVLECTSNAFFFAPHPM